MKQILKDVCERYDFLNYEKLLEYPMPLNAPIITVAMLSFMRYDRLISTLKNLLSLHIPLNLCIRVQGTELLTYFQKRDILKFVDAFSGHDIQFTRGNHGTGTPRGDVIERAYKHFDTPYILTTDDDMLWKTESLIIQRYMLETNKELGACSVTCTPHYNAWNIIGDKLVGRTPIPPFDINVDASGSGTMLFKRQILDNSEVVYDKNFYIGWADFDFCMQMRKKWKIGIIDIPELKIKNNYDPKAKDYLAVRGCKQHNINSKKYFQKKWGLLIS
jgi:hypothetical protein